MIYKAPASIKNQGTHQDWWLASVQVESSARQHRVLCSAKILVTTRFGWRSHWVTCVMGMIRVIIKVNVLIRAVVVQCWRRQDVSGSVPCEIHMNRWWHKAVNIYTVAESSMADRLQAGRSGLQIYVFMAWHRQTSLTKFIIQQSLSFKGVCVPHRLTNCLFPVPRLSTYGDRAFPVAAVRLWNSLPQHITSAAPSLPVFCSCWKTYFFELCHP